MTLQVQFLASGSGSQHVALRGRLDSHTYQALDQKLAPLLHGAVHSLVLDLAQLEYISSAGIRCLFKARKALAGHGGKVLVVNPQAQIQKVFDVVKAVPLNEIFASAAEADAYLDAMQRKVLQGEAGDGGD